MSTTLFVDHTMTKNLLVDWSINLLGFIPFGIFLAFFVGPRRLIIVVALSSAGLSLSIETMQLFFIDRLPQVEDFVLNTLGGTLGAWLKLGSRFSKGIFQN